MPNPEAKPASADDTTQPGWKSRTPPNTHQAPCPPKPLGGTGISATNCSASDCCADDSLLRRRCASADSAKPPARRQDGRGQCREDPPVHVLASRFTFANSALARTRRPRRERNRRLLHSGHKGRGSATLRSQMVIESCCKCDKSTLSLSK